MTHTQTQGADGAGTKTGEAKALSARTLAGMLRSRIERAAEHKSETVSLGQFFADQIHRYLTEAGNGPEHDARSGHVPADGGDPDCDRGRDWGLRARQVHLEALSKRAAGGEWFASTNGADGLARLDNGTDGMFPVRGEWHEIEFIEALVNAYRNGDLAAPAATPGVPDSLREAFAAATDSPVFVHDFADPAVSSAPGCQDVSLSFVTPDHITAAFMGNGLAGTIDQARKDAVALAAAWNHVRALIAAQPAGQAGDAGAETDALVDRFAAALKVKLRAAEAKYGWKNGWLKSDWQVECQNGLLRHVGKGDPLDVAAYAAFCWHHGWPSASRRSTDFVTGAVIPTAGAIAAYETRYPEGSLSETSDNAIEAWNRVAAAVLLADKPAPNSTRTGAAETGCVLVPAKATREWAYAMAVARQGHSSAPRCEPTSEREIEWAADRINEALAARPEAPSDAGWMPMSEAPTDGRDFIAGLWVYNTNRVRIGWQQHFIRADDEAERTVHPDTYQGWDWDHYTHCLYVETPPPPSDPAPSGQAEG